MKNKRFEFVVGLFLLAGFVAFAFLALRVSGLSFGASTESFQVTAKFLDIGSLKSRAKVTMDGVVIGKVSSVALNKEDFMADVVMEIDAYYDNLPVDSTASILTAGVLGEKYIGLEPGAEEESLKNGDVISDTQSAVVLEKLISKFLLSMGKKE